MKHPVYISAFGFLALLLLSAVIVFFCGDKESAKFLLDLLTALSVIFAIITALFGEVLKEKVQLSIELPQVQNNFTDDFEIKDKDAKVLEKHRFIATT